MPPPIGCATRRTGQPIPWRRTWPDRSAARRSAWRGRRIRLPGGNSHPGWPQSTIRPRPVDSPDGLRETGPHSARCPRTGRHFAAIRLAGPADTRGPGFSKQSLHMRQGCKHLLALDHAHNLLQVGQEVGTTELDLLARTAGAQGIGVDRHGEMAWVWGEWFVVVLT